MSKCWMSPQEMSGSPFDVLYSTLIPHGLTRYVGWVLCKVWAFKILIMFFLARKDKNIPPGLDVAETYRDFFFTIFVYSLEKIL